MGSMVLPVAKGQEEDVEFGYPEKASEKGKASKGDVEYGTARIAGSSQYSTAEASKAYKEAMTQDLSSTRSSQPQRASDYEYKPHSSTSQLPEGWQRFYDKRSQSYYYYNSRTEETSWEHPNDKK